MDMIADSVWAERASKAVLLVRILVGWVFLSEGIQKFLFPDTLGVGRFVKIGIPWPQFMAPFVGVVEIVFGALLLIGLFTRLAAIPLLIDICVALYSTKIVMMGKNGVWNTLHEARTDAEFAGSSPVVPAIIFSGLQIGTFGIWVQLCCNRFGGFFRQQMPRKNRFHQSRLSVPLGIRRRL